MDKERKLSGGEQAFTCFRKNSGGLGTIYIYVYMVVKHFRFPG